MNGKIKCTNDLPEHGVCEIGCVVYIKNKSHRLPYHDPAAELIMMELRDGQSYHGLGGFMCIVGQISHQITKRPNGLSRGSAASVKCVTPFSVSPLDYAPEPQRAHQRGLR